MKFHMIDYLGVTGNKRDGWAIKNNRLSKKMLSCKSTNQSDIIEALSGWGVIPSATGYRVAIEDGQFTVFECKTDKPVCAVFKFNGDA